MLKRIKKDYINPYLAGFFLGVVLFLTYAFTQSGLGASGGINRIEVAIAALFSQSHVDKVGYLAAMGGGDRCALNHSSLWMLIGTLIGGFLSAWWNGRLSFEVTKGPRISNKMRLVLALIGGVFMGYGARMARGCTSGQALSGGAVLSVGSWAFMLSVFAGAYLLAYFFRKIWN